MNMRREILLSLLLCTSVFIVFFSPYPRSHLFMLFIAILYGHIREDFYNNKEKNQNDRFDFLYVFYTKRIIFFILVIILPNYFIVPLCFIIFKVLINTINKRKPIFAKDTFIVLITTLLMYTTYIFCGSSVALFIGWIIWLFFLYLNV